MGRGFIAALWISAKLLTQLKGKIDAQIVETRGTRSAYLGHRGIIQDSDWSSTYTVGPLTTNLLC